MTNESKENLLKLLFNEGKQTPGQDIPTYYRLADQTNDLADKVEELEITKFSATPQRVLYKNGWVIGFNEHLVMTMKTNGETHIWKTTYSILDIYTDENGYYAIVNDGAIKLVYLTDFTELSPDGTYDLSWKISYDITQAVKDVSGDNSPTSSSYCGAYKVAKSPLDR